MERSNQIMCQLGCQNPDQDDMCMLGCSRGHMVHLQCVGKWLIENRRCPFDKMAVEVYLHKDKIHRLPKIIEHQIKIQQQAPRIQIQQSQSEQQQEFCYRCQELIDIVEQDDKVLICESCEEVYTHISCEQQMCRKKLTNGSVWRCEDCKNHRRNNVARFFYD